MPEKWLIPRYDFVPIAANRIWLGLISILFSFNFSEARRELDLARHLLPNDALALFLDARLDRHDNRWDDALIKANRAADLDPEKCVFCSVDRGNIL
jgi:hypothetical protein